MRHGEGMQENLQWIQSEDQDSWYWTGLMHRSPGSHTRHTELTNSVIQIRVPCLLNRFLGTTHINFVAANIIKEVHYFLILPQNPMIQDSSKAI
jgi:hypothetical protein